MALFVPNRKFSAEANQDPEYREGLAEAVEPARQLAETFAKGIGAPWMRRAGTSQTVVIDVRDDGVYIVNTDHGGHLMEYGSKNNPAHAPLRRAARAAGMTLDESE